MNIEHFPEKKVFQTVVDGETARLMYHVADGALDVRHTIVPGEIGGRGIASALVKAAYDYALANELVPVATCSYAVKWLEDGKGLCGGGDLCIIELLKTLSSHILSICGCSKFIHLIILIDKVYHNLYHYIFFFCSAFCNH